MRLAAGRAIVASRVGGLADAVVDGRTGLLVEPEDEAALAAALRRVVEDPRLRERLAAAVRAQLPVLIMNLAAAMENRALTQTYDGYSSCPLVTGYGRLVLAEFDYDLNPKETFPFDQGKERRSMYLLKKHVLPFFKLWQIMLTTLACFTASTMSW